MAWLKDLIITDELARRPSREADLAAENRAVLGLARVMVDAPDTVLQRVAEAAVALCGCGTAGLSLLDDVDGTEAFRWHSVAGAYAPHLMAAAPRRATPCGIALDRSGGGGAQLFSRPARAFPDLRGMSPEIVELLVLPLLINGNAVGALWLATHDVRRGFDREDVRLLGDLASLCATSLRGAHPGRAGETALRRESRMIEAQRAARDRLGDAVRHATAHGEQQARLFWTMLSGMPDAAFVLDPNARFLYANRALLDILRVRLDELVGKDCFDLRFPADSPERAHQQVRQVVETGRGLAGELEYTGPAGARRRRRPCGGALRSARYRKT